MESQEALAKAESELTHFAWGFIALKDSGPQNHTLNGIWDQSPQISGSLISVALGLLLVVEPASSLEF